MDLEWKAGSFTDASGVTDGPSALLQICSAQSCLLLHLAHMEVFPRRLRALLEDARVKKVRTESAAWGTQPLRTNQPTLQPTNPSTPNNHPPNRAA